MYFIIDSRYDGKFQVNRALKAKSILIIMVYDDDENNDDFAKIPTTSIEYVLKPSTSLHTKDYLENEYPRITNNESILSKSYCYSNYHPWILC